MDKDFSKNTGLKSHMNIYICKSQFKCSQSDRIFSHNSDLESHMRIHTEELPYHCTPCNICFSQKYSYKPHVNSQWGEALSMQQVRQTFPTEQLTQITYEDTKRGKPNGCIQCGNAFSNINSLNTHMKTHSVEKHKCNQCGNTFS